MANPAVSISEAVVGKRSFDGIRATCPHCGTFSHLRLGGIVTFTDNPPKAQGKYVFSVETATCTACNGLIVGAVLSDTKVIGILPLWPVDSHPANPPPGLDPDVIRFYAEACRIVSLSPTGASVLARRCLQQLIRGKLGIKKARLFDEIAEAVTRPELSMPTRQALDHIRTIGNWAAHPVENQANTVIDVAAEEAVYTLQVLELLFEDLYVIPARTATMQANLAKKK